MTTIRGGRPRSEIGAHGPLNPQETPNGRWMVDARGRGSDGRVRRIRATGDTFESAIALWRSKHEIYGGIVDSELTGGSRFETAARLWISARLLEARTDGGRVRVQSVEKDMRTLKADIVPAIGALSLNELTTPRLERWLASIGAEAGAQHTLVDKRRKCRSIVKQILDYAIRMGAISGYNPITATTSPPRRKAHPRALTVPEIGELREAVRSHRSEKKARSGPPPSPYLPVLIDLLLGSGCRIGEALALHWSEVHLADHEDGGVSTVTIVATMTTVNNREIRQDVTKSDTGMRTIIVPPFTADALRSIRPEQVDPQAPVFVTRTGTYWQSNNARRSLRAALEAAGIDPRTVHPHMLRATVATTLKAHGYDVGVAASVLGNTEAVAAKHYIERVHTVPDVLGVLQQLVTEQANDHSEAEASRGTDETS